MRTDSAYWEVVDVKRGKYLVLRDLGPWNHRKTITNDAESVVRLLVESRTLSPGQSLYYYDSAGELTELVVASGRLAGFGTPSPEIAREIERRVKENDDEVRGVSRE